MASSTRKKRKLSPLQWVVESIMDEPSYLQKPMFGCQACYLHGRLVLLLTSGAEPWNGLLIPTDHQFHESIKHDFTSVVQHPVLKKWLYLPEASEDFEAVASDIVEAIRVNDQRFGVEPKERKRKNESRGRAFTMFIAIIASTLLVVSGCTYMEKEPEAPPATVSQVDLARYMGVWYEIARYPNSFQKGCVGGRATYSLLDDGKVSVLNECYEGSLSGKLRSAKGKAWVVDKETNSKLKVSFFWFFAGDYWIIDIADDYSYVVVGHPDRKYLWILSRNKTMDKDTYEGILKRLGEIHHYDTSRLVITLQQ